MILTNAQDKGIISFAFVVSTDEEEPVQGINANSISVG